MNYSQNNEQQIITDYFGSFRGTFLDLGANDGVTLSNTFQLANCGWSGTLVEPSPKAFHRLRNVYRDRDKFELMCLAVGKEAGHVSFFESGEHLGTGDTSLLSTTIPQELTRWSKESFNALIVEQVTFDGLLRMIEHNRFDLISIDIEGAEMDVVPQIPFRKLDCSMAIIEFNGKHQVFFDRIMIDHHGYRLHAKNAENLIYSL